MTEQEIYELVNEIAAQSNCKKRHVGCLILDDKDTIVSSGCNWHEDGICDCVPGPSTALHAEIMAIERIPGIYKSTKLTAYINNHPCNNCRTALDMNYIEIVSWKGPKLEENRTYTVKDTLEERESTHGSFKESARFVQAVKAAMHVTPKWEELEPDQKEALHMIQHKIGRILYGDPSHVDSWHDLCGYAKLIEERLND